MKKKRKFNFFTILVSGLLLATSLSGCGPGVEEKVEELPATFINETLDFELTKAVETPVAKENSVRGTQIEKLVTLYAQSYESDDYLKEDVIRFRQWQWKDLYSSLEKKAKDNPRWLNTYRLQAEVYLTNSKYEAALASLDHVLSYHHDDVYALGLSAYVQHLLGNAEQKTARLKALENVSAKCKKDVADLITFVATEIGNEHGKGLSDTATIDYDSVGVLGVAPTASGEISTGGALRIKETVKAAFLVSKGNPDKNPKIIISGGALDTQFSEASVMKNYLVRNANTIAKTLNIGEVPDTWTIYGDQVILDENARDTVGNAIGILKEVNSLKLKNLLVIGSKDQVMRADCIFKAHATAMRYNVKITSAECSSNDPSSNQTKYAYVTSAVAYELFTKDDFAKHTKVSILADNELPMLLGKVTSDKESYSQGETASVNVVPAAGYEVESMSAKTSSGSAVELKNGKVVVGTENIYVNATFKPLANTATVSFFNAENFGTTKNGDTTISSALKKAEDAIREVTASVVSVSDNIHLESTDPNNALGYGKMGGFGLASSGRIGGFKVTFAEKYLLSKVVVTAVKMSESEGRIQVNGKDPTTGALQGEANTFDVSYTVEFAFDSPTNVVDLKTVAEEGNFGRVIIYGMTFFLSEGVKEYSITVDAVENGTVSAPPKAVEGAVIKLDIKGNPGYFVDVLKVTSGETEISVTSEHYFVMPSGDVNIKVTFVSRLSATTEIKLEGSKVHNDDLMVVGSVTLDKESYSVGEKASLTVKTGHGFILDSLSVKTVSGVEVTLASDYTFTFLTEDVIITATYKMVDKTFTISFFNAEIYKKGGNGTTDIAAALKEAETDIKALNEKLVSVHDTITPPDAGTKNALGYGKAGGFGLAAGGRVGWFSLKFAEDYKISKVVVNVCKNSATEGNLTVNGKVQTNTYNDGKLQGLPQQYDFSNLAEYVFDAPTNELTFATAKETVGTATNYGRVIIYSVTLYLA